MPHFKKTAAMLKTACRKRVIYLQIALFLLGSFSLLVQNAMAAGCHLHAGGNMKMLMQAAAMMNVMSELETMDSQKLINDMDSCCENCNCVGQHCLNGCSLLHSITLDASSIDSFLPARGESPVFFSASPVGVTGIPERRPPRSTVL